MDLQGCAGSGHAGSQRVLCSEHLGGGKEDEGSLAHAQINKEGDKMKQTGVVNYDAMTRSIAECVAVDELKDLRDKALALERYAAQANNLEAERQACSVRLRAERRSGVLLKESVKAKGMAGGAKRDASGHMVLPLETTPTLESIGISKKQSSDWQKLAEIPEEDFNLAIADPITKPTTSALVKKAKKAIQEVAAPEAPLIKINDNAQWIWGRLRDFERLRILEEDPAFMMSDLTDTMRADVRRIAPLVRAFFADMLEEPK